MSKKGILLVNLGTPKSNHPFVVKSYLKEFLSDPRIIDLPKIMRWLLVNFFIIPFRIGKTTKAYKKIWTDMGSPLLVNSLEITKAIKNELGEGFQVELGMRYGEPSIEKALNGLKSCSQIHVVPLFPQYSSATTGSILEKVFSKISKQWNIPHLTFQKEFYKNPGFIAAYADIIKKQIHHTKIDKLIFSYHGLPEKYLKKGGCQSNCKKVESCPNIESENESCYRAQCFATSRLLAKMLDLQESHYITTFQSRLGKLPWIKPYTDKILPDLLQQGSKNIAVVCPSFIADCLETLEEINIRLREYWKILGGNEFIFIPCINAHPIWIKSLGNYLKS